jgi:hypothetical protein
MNQEEPATFVVLTAGHLGRRITKLAEEHAAFDPNRRRVTTLVDANYPLDNIALWTEGRAIVALVLRTDGSLSDLLDANRALSEAWIENAFLRALLNRDSSNVPISSVEHEGHAFAR